MRHVAAFCIAVLLSTLRCEAIVSRKAASASSALLDTAKVEAKDGREVGNKPRQKHAHAAHHSAKAEVAAQDDGGGDIKPSRAVAPAAHHAARAAEVAAQNDDDADIKTKGKPAAHHAVMAAEVAAQNDDDADIKTKGKPAAHHAVMAAEATPMRNMRARSAQKPALVAVAKEGDETSESASADEKDEISDAAEREDRASSATTHADVESQDGLSEPDGLPKHEGALPDHTLRIKHKSGAASGEEYPNPNAHQVTSQRSSLMDDGDAGDEKNDASPQVSDRRDLSPVGHESAQDTALHAGHSASTGDAKGGGADESGNDSAGKTEASLVSQSKVMSGAQQDAMRAIMAEISQSGATDEATGNAMDNSIETETDAEGDASVLQGKRVARHGALAENMGGRQADEIQDDAIDTMGTSRAEVGAHSIDSRSRVRDEAFDGAASADEADRLATRQRRPDMEDVGQGVDAQQFDSDQPQEDAANTFGGVNEQPQEEAADADGGPIDQVSAIPRARKFSRRTHRRASFARVGARYRAQRRAAHQFHMSRRGEDSFEDRAESSALDDDSEDEDDSRAQATLRSGQESDEGEESYADGSDSESEEPQGEANSMPFDESQRLDDAETNEAPLEEDTVANGEDDYGGDQASLIGTSVEEEGDALAAGDDLGASDDYEGASNDDFVVDRVRDSDNSEESATDSSDDLDDTNGY